MSVEYHDRPSRRLSLEKYCPLADDSSIIEVTEWSNGEGWDVCIESSNRNVWFSLTYGEFKALSVLINMESE